MDEWLERTLPRELWDRFVFVAPTAGWGAKTWPKERYGAVAMALAEAGWATLVNAAPARNGVADASAEAVVKESLGCAVAAPSTMPQMMALIRRASLVIAGDTGPLHLAAALGRPVVALYGPTDPARTGPYGTRSRVLRHATSVVDHSATRSRRSRGWRRSRPARWSPRRSSCCENRKNKEFDGRERETNTGVSPLRGER